MKMKNLTLSLVILGGMLSAFTAIDLVEKEVTLLDNSKLIYHVNEKNEMQGAYSVQNPKNDITLRGSYTANKRTGNWYCFNNDKSIFLRYNYDLKKILFIDTVAIQQAEIVIIDKNPEAVKNASISVPVCAIDQYISFLKQEIIDVFPTNQMQYTAPTDIQIVAKLDTKNQVKYEVNYVFDRSKKTFYISGKNKAFTIDWIPAMYNGEVVASEFKVATQISFTSENGHKRFNWN